GSESGAQISPRGIEQAFAKSQAPGLVADQRSKYVTLAQRDRNGSTQRFLATANEDPAVDFPGAIKAGELFVQNPPQEHPTERLDILLTRGWGMVKPDSAALRVHYSPKL